MTTKDQMVLELLNDPTCRALMSRDGVDRNEVIKMMSSIRPVVSMNYAHDIHYHHSDLIRLVA